jgi:hypothetical protein
MSIKQAFVLPSALGDSTFVAYVTATSKTIAGACLCWTYARYTMRKLDIAALQVDMQDTQCDYTLLNYLSDAKRKIE